MQLYVVSSVADLVLYRALRLGQITRGPQRKASPEQLQDALGAYNDLIGSLNIQPEAIFSADSAQYQLSGNKQIYTIGPAGSDFVAPVPLKIEKANVVLLPATFVPMEIADANQWSSLSVRNVKGNFPHYVYCDYDAPAAHLYFWPIPTQACTIELWTWQALATAATIDTLLSVPPGYQEMLVYQTAMRLSDQFGTELRPNVVQMAGRLLGRVKAHNSPSKPIGSVDAGTSEFPSGSGGGFNYLTGQPG